MFADLIKLQITPPSRKRELLIPEVIFNAGRKFCNLKPLKKSEANKAI